MAETYTMNVIGKDPWALGPPKGSFPVTSLTVHRVHMNFRVFDLFYIFSIYSKNWLNLLHNNHCKLMMVATMVMTRKISSVIFPPQKCWWDCQYYLGQASPNNVIISGFLSFFIYFQFTLKTGWIYYITIIVN